MAVTIGGIAAYFGAGTAAAGTAAAGTAAVGAGAAGAAAAGTVAGLTAAETIAVGLAGSALSAGASALLAPDAPKTKDQPGLPDPKAQEEARKRSIAEQLARRGRASTVLTDSSGKLGG